MQTIEQDSYSNSFFSSNIVVNKRSGIVTITYGGNVNNVPAGNMGTLFTLDPKYFPSVPVRCMTFPTTNIQIEVSASGAVIGYNYGSEISKLSSARFSITYVAAN